MNAYERVSYSTLCDCDSKRVATLRDEYSDTQAMHHKRTARNLTSAAIHEVYSQHARFHACDELALIDEQAHARHVAMIASRRARKLAEKHAQHGCLYDSASSI